MQHRVRPSRAFLIGTLALGTVVSVSGVSVAATSNTHGAAARQQAAIAYLRAHGGPTTATHTPDDGNLADQFAQYTNERTAPSGVMTGDPLTAATQQAATMSTTGGAWQEFTSKPYNAEPVGYRDPFWSNVGSGFSLVGGRTTALVATSNGDWFAGTADGGVWRSSDQGQHWTPVFDSMPTLSIGALAVDPADGSLWVGTGEANQSGDSYFGTGVYRSTNYGASWQRVGDDASGSNVLNQHTVFRIAFDSSGDAYAATNNGLFRMAADGNTWTAVLVPAGIGDWPPYDQQVTDVAVVPGTNGQDVIAAIGWHGPGNTENNGFYESTDGGASFAQVTLTGDITAGDIGRTTFAYSADGSKLYAVVQSLKMLANGDASVLQGVYVSDGSATQPASVAGPWTKIADESTLEASGSALSAASGYGVGAQAWYNQTLAVDPSNADHVYLGLEEIFESTDGGTSWVTASPYWNYGLACGSKCPDTTHPDQHALMIANGKIVIGNDGGVYSRPLTDHNMYGGWTDLNATLHSWQYYDARAGLLGRVPAVWGGLQDNGTSIVGPGKPQMAEPAGGDGFDVIVDPSNANNMVGEYVYGTMYSSTTAGRKYNYYVSPTCLGQAIVGMPPLAGCDPSPRFVTPLTMDQQDPNTWLVGGEDVWVSHAGWNTTCTSAACTWTNVYDTGTGNSVTAMSSVNGGSTIYAAWVHGSGNPGPGFGVGIATNAGGTWHTVTMTGLPDRYIAGITADPSNPLHAYAIFSGYSRRFVPGGGVGHVFETTDGGVSWTDISGNLPDIASDALVLQHGELALGTDAGVYTAAEGQGAATEWSVLGTGLPNAAVNDLTTGPDGYIYAATHGRGVWRIKF